MIFFIIKLNFTNYINISIKHIKLEVHNIYLFLIKYSVQIKGDGTKYHN